MTYPAMVANPQKYFPNGVDLPQKQVDKYHELLKTRYVPSDADNSFSANMSREFAVKANDDPKAKEKREKQKLSSRRIRRVRDFVLIEVVREKERLQAKILDEIDELFDLMQEAEMEDADAFEHAKRAIFDDFQILE